MADDEQKALVALDRAAKAEALLNNEMLQESFAYIETEMIEQWKVCKEPEGRDRIWQATRIASRVQEVLRQVITNGKMAKVILDDIETKREPGGA